MDEPARQQLQSAGDNTAVYGVDCFELSGEERVYDYGERKKDNRGRDQCRVWPGARSRGEGSSGRDHL